MQYRTGYDLELNQQHQAHLRAQFEQEARLKALKLTSVPEKGEKQPALFSRIRLGRRGVSKPFGRLLASALVVSTVLLGLFTQNLTSLTSFLSQPPTTVLAHTGTSTTAALEGINSNPGSDWSTSSSTTANVASIYQTVPAPAGRFTTFIVAKDIPLLLRQDDPTMNKYLGEWQINLSQDGFFTASHNQQLLLQSQFEVNEDHQLRFFNSTPDSLCSPEEAAAFYQWQPLDDQHLQLTTVFDRCYVRSLVLATHPLVVTNPDQNRAVSLWRN